MEYTLGEEFLFVNCPHCGETQSFEEIVYGDDYTVQHTQKCTDCGKIFWAMATLKGNKVYTEGKKL